MMKEGRVHRAASLSCNIVTNESKTRMASTRKRKSDDIGETNLDKFERSPDFTVVTRHDKPVIVNYQEAFFDKNSPHPHERQPTGSPAIRFNTNERAIKPAKSFFDDDDERVPCENSKVASPKSSPRGFRKEFKRASSHTCGGGASPLSVVDELFTGFYGCMPQWECSLPWRGDHDSDGESEDEENDCDTIVRLGISRQDPEAVREHLSFPKHLGKEFVSKPINESRRDRNIASLNRTIRRTPSSRLTTLESDSRQKLPGSSKMFRRTEINEVTEIHWDEQVLDTATLEKMAELSVF